MRLQMDASKRRAPEACRSRKGKRMNISDITNIIVSATSLIAIVIALYTFWLQNKQAKIFLGVQILREWEHDFFSTDEMKRRRYIACDFMLNKNTGDLPQEAWEILDTFDCIAIYVNKGIVQPDIAWDTFYYWLNGYWHLLNSRIHELREFTDGTKYLHNVELMHSHLTNFGVRKRSLTNESKRCSESKMKTFLEDEICATIDDQWK